MFVGIRWIFHYNELAKIRECDVQLFEDLLEIFIESSKTDQYRNGAVYNIVVIARTGTNCCSVAMLERYMHLANISVANLSVEYLFRCLISTKNGQKLRDSTNLSYTRACELVLGMLESTGLDHEQFSLHSLRSGGALAAVNAGVLDRHFKRLGR